MERSVLDITLDLQRNCSVPEITVRRGDTHRTLRFFLADGGRPYDLTDVRAVLTAQKPDGTHLFNDCAVEGDRIVYDLTAQTTACPGQTECQLRLYGDANALLTTATFTLTVEDTVYTQGDEDIESTDETTTLTKLMTEADEKLARLDAVLAEKSRQYELIEEITLAEDVSSFTRTSDTNGVPYNFSEIRVKVRTAAATGSTQIIFTVSSAKEYYMIYHQQSNALATTERSTNLIARNDHGMIDYFCVNSSVSGMNYPMTRDAYMTRPWDNVTGIRMNAYSDAILIPAGTTITIYGVRG